MNHIMINDNKVDFGFELTDELIDGICTEKHWVDVEVTLGQKTLEVSILSYERLGYLLEHLKSMEKGWFFAENLIILNSFSFAEIKKSLEDFIATKSKML